MRLYRKLTKDSDRKETIQIGKHNRQGIHGRFDLTAMFLFQMDRENRTKEITLV